MSIFNKKVEKNEISFEVVRTEKNTNITAKITGDIRMSDLNNIKMMLTKKIAEYNIKIKEYNKDHKKGLKK